MMKTQKIISYSIMRPPYNPLLSPLVSEHRLCHIRGMIRFLKTVFYHIYKAGDDLVQNDGIELAGYLTFLAILSVFPFLVILVSLAGFMGQGTLGTEFIDLLVSHLPRDALEALLPRVEEIQSGPPQGLLTVSILGAIWTSSSAVEGMRTVLNRAYGVSEPPTYLFRRLCSMLQLVLFTAVIIIVMFVLLISPLLLDSISNILGMRLPIEAERFLRDDFIYIGGTLIFVGVASLYYWLPNVKQRLIGVVPGALLVVVLWILGADFVTYYMQHVSQVNIIYGSLSSFIATLLFFFVMNIIFIYGAEFNAQILIALGKGVEERVHTDDSPDDHVIRKKH
jgi:membrane protein